MKEIFSMDEDMVMEHFIIQVERNISENGKQIRNMAKEKLSFEMVQLLKRISLMIGSQHL